MIVVNTYETPETLKRLWRVEIDLLQKFQEICDKYRLKYYASGGTLLGAARHKGFIPWDDDIDIQMNWPDYKKLLEVAPKECEYPYFFQCYLTEKNGEISNSRIRRSDTTGCTRWEFENVADPNYNKGIFIDIFPLFNVPIVENARKEQKDLILDAWKAIRGFTAIESKKTGLITVNPEYEQYIDHYLAYSKEYTIEEIKALYLERCAMVKDETGLLGLTSYRVHQPNLIWEKKWFDETISLPFEDTAIMCPEYYDQVLKRQYGDWRTPVYNAACHEMHIYDAEIPFRVKLC